MAYSRQFLRVTWDCLIDGTDELGQTSLNLLPVPGPTFDAADALDEWVALGNPEDLVDAYINLIVDAGAYWADYSQLALIKIAAIDTDGTYLTDPVGHIPDTDYHGSGGQILPQSSWVISLRSGFSTGEANRGRCYIPHSQLALATGTPRASLGAVSDAVDAAATFIGAVNTAFAVLTTDPIVQILSRKGSGAARPVTAVRVGDVNDTQRRRRAQLAESYGEAAV